MFRSIPRRWLVLLGALLATVAAAVWPRGDGDGVAALEVVAPSARGREATPGGKSAVPAAVTLPPLGERLERPRSAREVENLFDATSWLPPAPKAAQVEPSVPTAPPFPYTSAGSIADNEGLTVVFMKQNQHFIVRRGEILESTYRIDEIDARSITVTYLPLGLQQVIPLGAEQ